MQFTESPNQDLTLQKFVGSEALLNFAGSEDGMSTKRNFVGSEEKLSHLIEGTNIHDFFGGRR